MVLIIAALVSIAVFVLGYLFGKSSRDELSKQNAAGVIDAVKQLNALRQSNRINEDQLNIAIGTLKDITKGTPVPELAASSALNSIQSLEYKD